MSGPRLAIDGGAPVRATMLDHRRGVTHLGAAERAAVLGVLERRDLFRYGGSAPSRVEAFEHAVATRLGTAHALATTSGTTALQAGLAALGVGPGDEVVVPAVTFVATVNAVVEAGAVPVFCDVDDSLDMDPDALGDALSPRTTAVVPVHLENVVADMDRIRTVAGDVPVFEDACQAMGATLHGRPAGTLGDLAAFSLQLEKNITAGEGGVLVTSDPDLHWRAARYGDQGGQFVTTRGGGRGGDRDEVFCGTNLRMNELTGAVAAVQVGRLDDVLEAMRATRARVLAGIGDLPGLERRGATDPDGDPGSSLTWFAPDPTVAARFVRALAAEGVPCLTMYGGEPVYATPAIRQRRTVAVGRNPWARHPVDVRYPPGLCPVAEDLLPRSITVGIGASWSTDDADDVVEAISKVAEVLRVAA